MTDAPANATPGTLPTAAQSDASAPAATTSPAPAKRQPLAVAAVQMVSTPDLQANLQTADQWIERAAKAGARLVALPEYFCLLGQRDTDKLGIRERDGDGPIQRFLADCSRRHQVWLLGGTVPLDSGSPAKVRNASLLYGPDGRRRARYDKIHLFGFQRGAERFNEAATIAAGRTPVVADLDGWRLGLSVCYDLRFPELYRNMSPVDLILVPSAFTYTTGAAHWELLLRARAIENQCYVLAPAQGGVHPNGRQTWGHSMLIDPWGEVVAVIDQGEGLASGIIDPARIADVRQSLPALTHRVM